MDKLIICLTIMTLIYQIKGFQVPRIIEHPSDLFIPRNDPATLNCKAEGIPAPTIQWYKDGVPLKVAQHRVFLPAGGLFFLKVVNSRRDSDAGLYWCEAKNELGVSRSRNATLQIAVLRDDFRLEPQNTRVAQSETALLECGPPKGTPEPTIMWKKNGQKLDMDASKRIRIVDGANLAIQDVRQADEGQYSCIAKNIVGIRESSTAFLKVHVKPFLIRGPSNQTVVEGTSVTFQCRVGGDPMPDVLWRRSASGGNMPLDRVHILEDRSLRLENVIIDDEGEYSCEADNAVGTISATGILNVYSTPNLVIRPVPKVVEAPTDVSFECKATGQPPPILFWSIEGNRTLIFPPNSFDRFETTFTPESSSILTIPATAKSDNGIVLVCSAVNSVGSISVRARLTISSQEDRPPPIILLGPVNQTLPVKSMAVLVCKAIGIPTPIISWYMDGNPVTHSERVNITESGSLVISDLDRLTDQGLYTCVASSRSGKSTWSGFLRLDSPTNPNIKFYRAPESAAFPSAPGKPEYTNVTETSVTISWLPSVKSGGSEIIGYTIELFPNDNTKGWLTIAQRVESTSFVHDTVVKDLTYIYVVRAENTIGLGLPSPMSDTITIGKDFNIADDINLSEAQATLSSGNVVNLLEANATDSTSVRLAWEIVNGQYVEGFYIYSIKANSNGIYKMLTVLHGGGASACTITSLDKFTMYNFFLIPFYKNIEGRPSNSKQTTTLEDVPSLPPVNMEAILLNTSAVYIKWQMPPNETLNGALKNYNVIIKGYDMYNMSRILTNMTVDGDSPKLLLANLSAGVTYSVSVAASTRMGMGPYSPPSILRLDPNTKKLDQGYTRYPINRDYSDDIITQTWFIILLGSIIAIIVFLFGATILFRRIQYIKHNSLTSVHGNHAIGTVRKFPTLPLNANGVWIDPTGGVWRQATDIQNVSSNGTKENISDYAHVSAAPTLPLPVDYERLSPLNMPDYAEVAGCSSFKNSSSPTYDTFGAYATATLVGRQYQNSFKHKNVYSAPNSVHYNNFINSNGSLSNVNGYQQHQQQQQQQQQLLQQQQQQQQQQQYHLQNGMDQMRSNNQSKINIIENKMEHFMNNLNNPSDPPSTPTHKVPKNNNNNNNNNNHPKSMSNSVPQTPMLGTIRRNRFNSSNNSNINKLASYGDKINFGADDHDDSIGGDSNHSLDTPQFIKSKYDGSWISHGSSGPSTTMSTTTTNSNNHSPFHHTPSPRHRPMTASQQSSLNLMGDQINLPKSSNPHLSSFGKSDKV